MIKNKKIDKIFNILVQYEKIKDNESEVNENSYKNYLDRLHTWYMGYGNEEITIAIEGLYNLGAKATHDSVKRTVFHLIAELEKEME